MSAAATLARVDAQRACHALSSSKFNSLRHGAIASFVQLARQPCKLNNRQSK